MDPTPQTYFAKLVDVQFDVAAMWRRTKELPRSLYNEIEAENIERRDWKGIASYRTVEHLPDPPSPENFAKLQNFHDQWLAAVATFKEHQLSAAQLANPDIMRTFQRLKIDLSYNFAKARSGPGVFGHYVNNSFFTYRIMPGLNHDDKSHLARLGGQLSLKGEEKIDEVLRHVESEKAVLESDDHEEVSAFHDRLLTALETMKQIRMQTEYDMQAEYERILSQVAARQTSTPAGKFTP